MPFQPSTGARKRVAVGNPNFLVKRKVNKEKFVKLEQEWLANEEVNIWKSLKWTGRLKTDILKD